MLGNHNLENSLGLPVGEATWPKFFFLRFEVIEFIVINHTHHLAFPLANLNSLVVVLLNYLSNLWWVIFFMESYLRRCIDLQGRLWCSFHLPTGLCFENLAFLSLLEAKFNMGDLFNLVNYLFVVEKDAGVEFVFAEGSLCTWWFHLLAVVLPYYLCVFRRTENGGIQENIASLTRGYSFYFDATTENWLVVFVVGHVRLCCWWFKKCLLNSFKFWLRLLSAKVINLRCLLLRWWVYFYFGRLCLS